MDKVEFTVAEVMDICEVSRYMVLGWIAAGKFPDVHFLYDSPKLGHRIPARNLLPFIERTNPMITGKMERAIAAKEREMSLVG